MTNVILNECEWSSQLFRHPEERRDEGSSELFRHPEERRDEGSSELFRHPEERRDEGSSEVYDMKKALLKQGLRMEKVFPSSVRAERSLSEP